MHLAYISIDRGPLVRVRGRFKSAQAAASRLLDCEYGEVRLLLPNGQEQATHHVHNNHIFSLKEQA